MQEKKSGKQATKGQKQVYEENVKTLSFYRNMSFGAVGVYSLFCGLFWSTTTGSDLVFNQLYSVISTQFCNPVVFFFNRL